MVKKLLLLTFLLIMLLAASGCQPKPNVAPEVDEPEMPAPTATVPLADGDSSLEMATLEPETLEPETREEPVSNIGETAYQIISGESTLTYEVGKCSLAKTIALQPR